MEWTEEEILSRATSPPEKESGVYALIHDDEIVYIGQSCDMRSRLQDHQSSNKTFDQVSKIPCDTKQERLDWEERLIERLDPDYNGYDPENMTMKRSQLSKAHKMLERDHISTRMIALRTGLTKTQVRKIRSGHSYMRVYDDIESAHTNKGWQ